ncbi:amidohydrolase family protein [uncultured Jatrophihabitans sp.]|uniref:amidohydrolase family protein n=1 Tax=uncultured Jatrophihabitans sp. TaxID=1610747 RepID=UPI0035CB1E76
MIFDLVVHVHNLLRENLTTPAARVATPYVHRNLQMYKRGLETIPPLAQAFRVPPDPQVVYDKIFGHGSEIDYAMAQVVPMFDLFAESPEENYQRVYELTRLAPDRIVFCGGTDPVLRGVNTALRDIEGQVSDLGARSIKLYTAHAGGASWRMDDRYIAYPMYERMLELGCNLVQVHKGDPQGTEPLDALHPRDVHQAALDFPELNFIVHHLAFPFEDEAIDLAARLPNVYVAMSTWINMIRIAPVETAMRLGKMLRWCGPEKAIWGSETPLWPSAQALLEDSYTFQISEDLRRGWDFPEITDDDRRLMFGHNLLRLLDLEPLPAVGGPRSPVGRIA